MSRLTHTMRLSSTPSPCATPPGAARSSTTRRAADAVRTGFLFDVGAHLIGDVVPRRDRQRRNGDDGGGDEGEQELAVEAGADLAQEGPSRSFHVG